MTRRARRTHSASFKAKVALAQEFDVHANQITAWRARVARRGCRGVRSGADRSVGRSAGGPEGAARQDRAIDAGERFFIRCAHQGRIAERKEMIDRKHDLPVVR